MHGIKYTHSPLALLNPGPPLAPPPISIMVNLLPRQSPLFCIHCTPPPHNYGHIGPPTPLSLLLRVLQSPVHVTLPHLPPCASTLNDALHSLADSHPTHKYFSVLHPFPSYQRVMCRSAPPYLRIISPPHAPSNPRVVSPRPGRAETPGPVSSHVGGPGGVQRREAQRDSTVHAQQQAVLNVLDVLNVLNVLDDDSCSAAAADLYAAAAAAAAGSGIAAAYSGHHCDLPAAFAGAGCGACARAGGGCADAATAATSPAAADDGGRAGCDACCGGA